MIQDTEVIVSAYAEDTTLYLKDKYSLVRAIMVLNNFLFFYGTKVNLDKSDVLSFGMYQDNPPDISDLNMDYANSIVKLWCIIEQ